MAIAVWNPSSPLEVKVYIVLVSLLPPKLATSAPGQLWFVLSFHAPISPAGSSGQSPLLVILSGNHSEQSNFTSRGHQLFLRWSTDHATSKRGFRIRYTGELGWAPSVGCRAQRCSEITVLNCWLWIPRCRRNSVVGKYSVVSPNSMCISLYMHAHHM